MFKTDTFGDLAEELQRLESQNPDLYKELCKAPIFVSKTVASVPNYAIYANVGDARFHMAYVEGE